MTLLPTGNRSRPIYPNPLATTLVVVCAAVGLSASSATAALIGPQDLSSDVRTGAFTAGGCTYENVRLPGSKVRSPFNGTITRWRVHIPSAHDTYVNDGPIQLQVLRRIDNQPGVVNDQFEVVRQTPEQSVMPLGVQAFNADMRIRKGHFIGFTGASDTEVANGTKEGAYHLQWCSALTPGGPGGPASFAIPGDYLLYNATVKD